MTIFGHSFFEALLYILTISVPSAKVLARYKKKKSKNIARHAQIKIFTYRSYELFCNPQNSCSGFIDSVRTASDLFVGSRILPNSKLFLRERQEWQANLQIFQAILRLFQGNMLYFLSVVVAEYLDL